MTIHAYKNAAVSALAVTALACAAPAQAASDYLLQLDGIPGESKIVNGAGPGAGPHVKKEKWIVLESVQLGAERTAGGEVAPADHNIQSPRDAASGQATGKRMHKPVRVASAREASAPSVSERKLSAGDTQTAALLLPAVQKVREAAARMSAWKGCAAGQTIAPIAIKQKSTGRTGRILDPVMLSCATDSVSFNFTKIEWK